MKMIMRSLVLLLISISVSFANWEIDDWHISFKSVVDKFSKMQTVAEKLARIAPVKTTAKTYLGYDGRSLGSWGEPRKTLEK